MLSWRLEGPSLYCTRPMRSCIIARLRPNVEGVHVRTMGTVLEPRKIGSVTGIARTCSLLPRVTRTSD